MRTVLPFFAFMLAAGAAADGGSVSFQIKKPEGAITLAEPFRLELEAAFPQGYVLNIDTATQLLDNFDIAKIERGEIKTSGNESRESISLEIVPFDIGLSTFPALNWTLAGASSVSEIKSPEIPLEIAPYETDKEKLKDIIDIRPLYLPPNYLLWFIIAILLAALAYFAHRYWKKRNMAAALLPEIDNRPPETRAYDAINGLLAGGLWEKGELKSFYNALADIFRDYLTRRTNIPAALYTTTELCRLLKTNIADRMILVSIREFLTGCDMVKFAKYLPSLTERDRDIAALRDIIDKTTPKPAEQPGAQPAEPAKP